MIRINEKYYIGADKLNIILKEKTIIKDTKSKNFGNEVLTDVGFFMNVESALSSIYDKSTKYKLNKEEKISIKEAIDSFKSIKNELMEDIKGVKINE